MKFWQAITWAETEQLPAIARFAEELGYHGLMGGDHAVYPERISPDYPYSDNGLPPMQPEDEYPEQHVLFASLAAVTSRLRFTTGVYVLPARNPHEVARATATLAILSGGRFTLGVGVGWMREEFDIYGVDFRTRGRRTDEMIEVLKILWTGEMVEYHGEHFDFPRVRLSPAPPEPPLVYIGGASEPALRRAARMGDGYIGAGTAPEDVPRLLARLRELRREYGRDHLPFEAMLGLTAEPGLELFKRMAGQGLQSTVAPPFAYVLGKRSSLDDKKRVMERFAENVIRHF